MTSYTKEKNYRNPALLALAKGQECMVNLPYLCNHNSATVVAAHSDWLEHGKGMGIKASDVFVCWACSECHRELDQGSMLSDEEKRFYWNKGFKKTLEYMFETKMLVINKRGG